MRNVLILHGTGNDSQGNWFPWLKTQLEKNGFKVWVPDLPESDVPNMKKYEDFIFSSDWEFDNNSIIVGHSSGAVAALGLLQKLPKEIAVDSCLLIASFKDDLGVKKLSGLFDEPFDFAMIKQKARNFIFMHSDNDPYCPVDHAEYLAKKLDGKLIIKKGQGHFNLQASPKYREFPGLLELILSEDI